jgi:hypothetical protein
MFIGLLAEPINNLGGVFRVATENGHIGCVLILRKLRNKSGVQGKQSVFGFWFTVHGVN